MKITRRTFLEVAAGTSAAIAAEPAVASVRKLIPYVIPPENIRPGVWTLFATTCRECPAGCGMQMRVIDGRPINALGNPAHPVNLGGLCARGQSCVQGLYDPDRLREPLRQSRTAGARPVSWSEAIAEIGARLGAANGHVTILSGLETGTLPDVMHRFVAAFGLGQLAFYEPFSHESLFLAHEAVFGRREIPEYHLEECELIVSFAADFLETWVSPVQYAHQFSAARSLEKKSRTRMVYVGPRLSMTAANADEFIRVPPGGERQVALAMLEHVTSSQTRTPLVPGVAGETIRRLTDAFKRSESSVALAGPVGSHSPVATETAKLAALLNHAARRVGTTMDFSRTHALGTSTAHDEMQKFLDGIGPDDIVIIHNANPAFALPGAETALKRAGTLVCLGTMPDETAALASWVLPIDSPLESWGDYEPWTGVHGVMQPTISPLYDTRPAGDVLLSLAAAAGRPLSPAESPAPLATFQEWLVHRWELLRRKVAPPIRAHEFWTTCLRNGGFWETPASVKVELNPEFAEKPSAITILEKPGGPPNAIYDLGEPPAEAKVDELALWAWASPMLYDGRTANHGWIQEAPDPMTTIVWGSWADVHPKTAAALGIRQDDVIELRRNAEVVEVPVRITEDVAEGMVALAFGQGHTAMGRNAAGRGANVFRLLEGADSIQSFGGPPNATNRVGWPLVTVRRTGARRSPVRTCSTQDQHGREILRWVPLADVVRGCIQPPPDFSLPLEEGYDPKRDVQPGQDYAEHRWVMAIDLARCIGCGACAVACYAENNIPVMGEEQVRRARVMAWLRIVPYRDPADASRVGFLPVLCQQCDSAPCEPVCPVFASVHNEEGLNAQVYNRCIGTRYCSNNCPYKVRRFNWLNVRWEEPLTLQLNPEVTVRVRGVMEKCTFCIQRIRQAEVRAKRENRGVRDGEIQPACGQSCPTEAILFGDLLDSSSAVSQRTRTDPRRYHLLEELSTKPAVTYLQRIRMDPET